MNALAKVPVSMSVDEFLAWNPGDGRHWQLVDGEPQAMAPASIVHAALQNELGSVLRNHLRAHRPGCVVLANPGVIPGLLSDRNVRIPDLAVTCSRLERATYDVPDPVLIVEILSPSNQAETWSSIWAYATLPTVLELVVLHTATVAAHVLRRTPDGTWPVKPGLIEDGDLTLESIAFRTSLMGLYQDTPLHLPPKA